MRIFFRIASAEIDWLYEYIAESGYALVLTDASGIVLYEQTDPTLQGTFRAAGLRVGADWSERQEGTNGIGTCIAENLPVTCIATSTFARATSGSPAPARRFTTRRDLWSPCWTPPRSTRAVDAQT